MTPEVIDSSITAVPDNQNMPLYGNTTVKQNTPFTTDAGALKTVEAAVGENAQCAMGTNVSSGTNVLADDNRNTASCNIQFPVNESPLNAAAKESPSKVFTPIDHKDITTPRLPILPPPPMFSNPRSSQTTVGKSVLPPSVARRISANQPLIKPQVGSAPAFPENIFVPTIPETSDPIQPSPLAAADLCIRPPIVKTQFNPAVSMVSQASSVPVFKPPSNPPSAVGTPFFTPARSSTIETLTSPELSQHSTRAPSNTEVLQAYGTAGPSIPPPTSAFAFGTIGPSSLADVQSSAPPSSTAPFVPMFTPASQIPAQALFNSSQTSHDMPHPITQIPPGITPGPDKPLVQPPKATGINFRMTKKRPQYYSGPIEGVGDISNNVKPIIASAIAPVPSVDASAYPGSFFIPEQQTQTVEGYEAPEVVPVPFDIIHPVEPAYAFEPKPQCPPFDTSQPQSYSRNYTTAFDLSRATTEAYELPKQEPKRFGIIGSLKSKLSSIDINKIQSTVTTFFDPAYNDAKGEPALETDPNARQQYGQYSQEQSNFEIMVPSAEQNQYKQLGYQQGYSYDQNNQYYQTQNAYNYQNEGQNVSSYFAESSYSTQVYSNSALSTDTQDHSSATTNYTQENIPQNIENINQNVEEKDSVEAVTFYNPAAIQEHSLTKVKSVANYPQQRFENPNDGTVDIATPFVSPNVGSHGAIGDVVKTIMKPQIGIDQAYKHFTNPVDKTDFFDTPKVGDEYNVTKDAQIDSVQNVLHFSAPLPPAMSFFDSPIAAQETKIKAVDLDDEMEKLALAEEIAIASSPLPAINLQIGAKSESKLIETSVLKTVGQTDIKAVILDENVKNFHINKDLGTEKKGISLIESLSKDTTPVVAVSSVPLFGLSAIITDKIKDAITNAEKDDNICLFEASQEIKSQLEKQPPFSYFENISTEKKLHEDRPKAAVLSISDVKNVLLIEPPEEKLGTVLHRKVSACIVKDLPGASSAQNLSEDRDGSWNLDAAMITSKDNVNMSFDRKASGFFDHLTLTEIPVEGIVCKKETDASEKPSDFNICETCREVKSPEGKDTENVTNQLIENINSCIQLSNPNEMFLTECNPTNEERAFEDKQYDDINRITEDTIETLQGQSAAGSSDNAGTSSNSSYGWNTEQLAYASIAAIDQELVENIGVEPKYNTIDPQYTFKIDPIAIGLFGDNSLFFDNVPNNASDEIKAELKTHDDVVLPRQMSIPSAPPAEEDDSKSDETGVIDVVSIEQDAKNDFPLEEEFVIEPSETDDDKLEFRERKRSSEDSVHDTFADRIEKFKSKAGVEFTTVDDNSIYQKNVEHVTSPKPMASYFETGNYAAERHRNSLTSPTNINTYQKLTGVLQDLVTDDNVFKGTVLTDASEEAFRLPPGFEDQIRRQFLEHQTTSGETKELFIPDTTTQTRTTTTATSNLVGTHEYYAAAGLIAHNKTSIIPPVDTRHAYEVTTMEQCLKDNIQPATADNVIPTLAKAFGSTNLLIKDNTQIFGAQIELNTVKATEPGGIQSLPDPINFFASQEEPKQTTSINDNPEGFSRLASYFSMPPAQPDHSKSFFELSQSQNHYRHVTNTNNLNQVDKTQANLQNLMQDLTSPQNINYGDEIVRTVNYFSVEYENVETQHLNLNTNSDVKPIDEHNIDSFKFKNKTQDSDDAASSINNSSNKSECSNKNIKQNDEINTINTCKYCCNTKLIDVKDYKVRTAADSDTRKKGAGNMSERDSSNQRRSDSVEFGNLTMDEEAQDGVAVVHEVFLHTYS